MNLDQFPNPFEQINAHLESINTKLDELAQYRNEPKLLTLRETSEFVNLSRQTVYGLVHNKRIPFHKRGNRLWFDQDELVDWLKGKDSK